MVGIDTEMDIGRTKGSDCGNDVCVEPCVCENGVTTPQLEDFDVEVVGVGVKGVDVCPFTPNPRRENGDSVIVVGSPLSSESPKSSNVEGLACTSSDEVVGSRLDGSPRTPEEGVFNPFAPGPEEMCLAPLCKRLVKESRRIVARRLDFDDGDEVMEEDKEVDALIEQELLDTVYGMLLEAIILKQTEDFLAENDPLDLEGCRTPTSPPPLNGIAETCPKAPVKASARKSLNIDPGLCKKLEF